MASFSFKPFLLVALLACGSGTTKNADSSIEVDSTLVNDTSAKGESALVPVAGADISLPAGFKAGTVVESLGRNRHIAVNGNGDIYVKTSNTKNGKGIYVLRDADKDGKYEVVKSFGNYGGTGIAISNGYLYASSDEEVFRYKLVNNEVSNPDAPEKIITGLLSKGTHASKSIALDNAGNIYVNIGAPSNACQVVDRSAGSPGQDPCPILKNAGGIWQFKADKLNQSYAQGLRYATGLRNVVGLDWNSQQNQLYAMQHGRDQLNTVDPDQYNDAENAELPAEEFFLIKKGGDYGWPYCYYDPVQKKKVLGPEYGGDGKKQDRCAGKEQPIYAFPAHWAPNAVLFYTGNMFPAKYKNGVFIAFHGSWNRAPLKQGGFNVVFLPFKNGMPSGTYEVFADGFTGKGAVDGADQAQYRPCGLAQGPDGSIYISDSKKGRIWKISY
ncbi:MAG TPA: PQQ-dependent sugar dehydrogenase [Chitinophagaceae bacterium]|nr:PQQ-dependent sugar dehydrogenase [Chitinophagaceae bacterium]